MARDRTILTSPSLSSFTGLGIDQDPLLASVSLEADWNENDILVTDPSYNEVNPSIASAPSGDLYVAVERLADSKIVIYRSTNNGQSWSAFWASPSSENGSHNPSLTYIETSSEKWVCVVYERVESDSTRTIRFLRINPGNSTDYDLVSVLSGITMAGTDDHVYPRIATDNIENASSPNLYLTYAQYGADYYRVYFTKSTDKGTNWSDPINVTGSAENSSSATQPDIAYGSSGLFITFTKLGQAQESTNWYDQVFVIQSVNSGEDWTTPIQLTTDPYDEYNKYHPRIVVSHGDTSSVLIGYTIDYGTDTDVESYSSLNGGTTWSGPYLLPWIENVDEKGVDLAVSTDQGKFHATYWRENSVLYTTASVDIPKSWSSPVLVNETAMASSTYVRPAVTVNPTLSVDSEVAVVWTDTRNAHDSVYFDSPFSPPSDSFLPAIYLLLLFQ
ncbi:MAG: sialidase family protein [Candidatus Electrothrix scaldis]|nr:MAG: sialidase family protein [Candidatus Electrothrix sp. GW3-3]